MQNVKYQRVEVVYPTGTAAGLKNDVEITLDPEMGKAIAIAMYPIKDGGVAPVRIGLRDQAGLIQEPTHQDDYIDKGMGGYYDRKKPLDIVAGGRKVHIAVDIPEVLASELSFDLVFMLANN